MTIFNVFFILISTGEFHKASADNIKNHVKYYDFIDISLESESVFGIKFVTLQQNIHFLY